MLDPATNEIIYASNGCDELHESEDTGNEDVNEDNNLESNIRRRKGKIISCAKETIEQGETHLLYIYIIHRFWSIAYRTEYEIATHRLFWLGRAELKDTTNIWRMIYYMSVMIHCETSICDAALSTKWHTLIAHSFACQNNYTVL